MRLHPKSSSQLNLPSRKLSPSLWDSNHKKFLQFVAAAFLMVVSSNQLMAQVQASGYGFNYFERQWITNTNFGAGYSFYAGVWPIMQEYPGPNNFQLGLPSTWLSPQPTGNEPSNFYNTIEGGLGWWGDTRFGTETPKFIMGGVAFDFNQWANGVGAGSTGIRADDHRDWNEPGGKYGVAQLSPNLLWPPDGLNMEQGANGAFLGYGYHPLPITDPMTITNGQNFATGNQCWTLFLNTTNFKGPATFFIPTFWTETVLNDPSLEGLFLDTRPSDQNLAFAIEYAESPALIGTDIAGDSYARILPLVFPKTTETSSELIREIKVYSQDAKWDAVENWFDGGTVPSTEFQVSGTEDIVFQVNAGVDGNIATDVGTPIDARIDFDPFAEKVMSTDLRTAGFEWNPDVVTQVNDNFVLPEYYKLNASNLWDPVTSIEVPAATGLLTNTPEITPRPEDVPYLTPMEPDCHLQDPLSPWNSPGPVAGPFMVSLGDGSRLVYYWYRFIDQPSIIHANLPETMRQNMQTRIEQIHTSWTYTDSYLAPPTEGDLVGLDPGLIVTPPAGMEIGFVPIVTRQEKDPNLSTPTFEDLSKAKIYPNPTSGLITIESKDNMISAMQLFDARGRLMSTKSGLKGHTQFIDISTQNTGIYFLSVTYDDGVVSNHKIIKSE